MKTIILKIKCPYKLRNNHACKYENTLTVTDSTLSGAKNEAKIRILRHFELTKHKWRPPLLRLEAIPLGAKGQIEVYELKLPEREMLSTGIGFQDRVTLYTQQDTSSATANYSTGNFDLAMEDARAEYQRNIMRMQREAQEQIDMAAVEQAARILVQEEVPLPIIDHA